MTLPIFDLSTDEGRAAWTDRLERLRATASLSSEVAEAVSAIVERVRERGDEAVVEYMRRWTDPEFQRDRIRVTASELDQAERELDPGLRQTLEAAIENVRAYQHHIRPPDPEPVTIAGAELGLRFTPVASAGLIVPGGVAVLVSTLVMLAVPALVAGVDPARLRVVNPPPTRRRGEAAGDVSPGCSASTRSTGTEAPRPSRRWPTAPRPWSRSR